MHYPEKRIEEELNQILSIAKERAQTLEHLRQALLARNDKEIIHYAYEICGLKYESDRVSKGINAGTSGR